MIKFEDVKNVSTEEYFNNNQFSIDAFNKKYKKDDTNETYVEGTKRVIDYIASAEKTDELKQYWAERWFDDVYNDWWEIAGSIRQGAGSNKKISTANCTHVDGGRLSPDEEWDNLESIFRSMSYTVAKDAAYRQGLGIDFSRLRPCGMSVLNSSKESTGVLHWMKYVDNISYFIGQKGRIPAFLFSLSCKHPEIEQFIKVKSSFTTIQNANISVQATNDFYEAVINNLDWKLEFEIPEINIGDKVFIGKYSAIPNEHIYDENLKKWYYIAKKYRPYEKIEKIIKASYLLELIAKGMISYAEPGLQNIDIAAEYSNSDALFDEFVINLFEYDPRVEGTNACSEQYLSMDSNCILSSLNMGIFSTIPEEYKKQLKEKAYSINRFVDNVIEKELQDHTYPTEEQAKAYRLLRRTGVGFTNMGAWLIKQDLEYGTDEGNKAVEEFQKCFNYYLYKSTIELGKEKGNFELFDPIKIKKSKFIQNLIKEFPEFDIELTHMRNVTLSSIAPTGTLSLMFRKMPLNYAIEPGFGLYWWKRTRISGKYKYYFNVPNIVREIFESRGCKIPISSDTIEDTWDGKYGSPVAKFIDENKSKINLKFKSATEITPFQKMKLMAGVQKWVDSSISTTYMIPPDYKWEDMYQFLIEAWKNKLKSIAAFPDKKMYGIVSDIPFKKLAQNLIKDGVEIHAQNFDEKEREELLIDEQYIKYSDSPRRPKLLLADIHKIKVKDKNFIIVLGLLNGAPYEIFGGEIGLIDFQSNHKNGKIEKVSKGHYKLYIDDSIVIDDFQKQFNPVEKIVFRLLSSNLRHGVPIHFIVEQLQKSTEDITTMASAISRVLKKYIKEGTKAAGITCPNCGSNTLIYKEGCIACSKCEWEKC